MQGCVREQESLGRGSDSRVLVAFDNTELSLGRAGCLLHKAARGCLPHLPGTASSNEAERAGAVLEAFLEEA